MQLSDVFKFTQGLGQKGHQIGRKVGDAMELLTLGMIHLNPNLSNFLIIEDGVEGATTAKHKVEFSFYNLENNIPSKKSDDLFGIIECKKVGVEQTVKQHFKKWQTKPENKKAFYLTKGYTFTSSPTGTTYKWSITIQAITDNEDNNIKVTSTRIEKDIADITHEYFYNCGINSQILIAIDVNHNLNILAPNQNLSEIEASLNKCIIIQIKAIENGRIKTIHVNEALPGPQTPEKAKQASFVSLDVRKKVLGRFDKTENKNFISILIIGEGSHWERKSRAMVRLCNDYNLIIPDEILVYLFTEFKKQFGENYQNLITKTAYKDKEQVASIISRIIVHFNHRIFKDMDTDIFVKFNHQIIDNKNRLIVEKL